VRRKRTNKCLPVRKRAGKESAFTLIELLCVLALIGIILAVAAPALQGFGEKRNLEIAARALATEMRKAQQKAITSGCGQTIEFRDNDRYRVVDTKTHDYYTVYFPEGITYKERLFPKLNNIHYLRYNYNGSPSSGGRIGLGNSAGDRIYVIVTPATGRVRISGSPPEP